MIPTNLTDQQMILLLQRLASHKRLADKWFKEVKVKPARKGEIFGKGGEGKKPKNKHRATFVLSDYAKAQLGKFIESEVE